MLNFLLPKAIWRHVESSIWRHLEPSISTMVLKNSRNLQKGHMALNYSRWLTVKLTINDKKLNFKENIQQVCRKVAQKSGFFSRIAKNISYQVRIKVYKSIIATHFDYCVTPEGSHGSQLLQKHHMVLKYFRWLQTELQKKIWMNDI